MAISKVVYGDETLIDISSDTVDASHLASGYTAHGSDGNSIIGTYVEPTDLPVTFTTQTPSETNTHGLVVAMLSTEPSTFYEGYLYLIDE